MALTPNLTQPEALASFVERVRSLYPESPRHWGRMSVSRMLWHMQEDVVGLIGRCAAARKLRPHPAFGPLSYEAWQHWGGRHPDHHLRQFGA